MQLPPDLIKAAYGGNGMFDGANLANIEGVVPPVGTGAIMGSAECKAKCGLS